MLEQVYAQQLKIENITIHGKTDWAVNISSLVSRALPYIFAFAGFGLLVMIVFSGFQLLTSAGNPKQMEAGNKRLTMAIVGFFIIFFAFWAVQLAGRIFGFDEINNIFN